MDFTLAACFRLFWPILAANVKYSSRDVAKAQVTRRDTTAGVKPDGLAGAQFPQALSAAGVSAEGCADLSKSND